MWASHAPPIRFSRQPQSQIQVSQQKSKKISRYWRFWSPDSTVSRILISVLGFFPFSPSYLSPPTPTPPTPPKLGSLGHMCFFRVNDRGWCGGGLLFFLMYSTVYRLAIHIHIYSQGFSYICTLYSIYVHHLRNKRYCKINTINLTSN